MMSYQKEKQTQEEFLKLFSTSLAKSIIDSTHHNLIKHARPFSVINLYGPDRNILELISEMVKIQLGSPTSMYRQISHTFNQPDGKQFFYQMDVGWFFSIYNKNGRVEF